MRRFSRRTAVLAAAGEGCCSVTGGWVVGTGCGDVATDDGGSAVVCSSSDAWANCSRMSCARGVVVVAGVSRAVVGLTDSMLVAGARTGGTSFGEVVVLVSRGCVVSRGCAEGDGEGSAESDGASASGSAGSRVATVAGVPCGGGCAVDGAATGAVAAAVRSGPSCAVTRGRISAGNPGSGAACGRGGTLTAGRAVRLG